MNPLWTALIRIAARIGRWLLDVAARRGGKWLSEYMEERVILFRKRLARAKTDNRKAWLKGRIVRWLAGAKWLREHSSELDDKALQAVCDLPAAKKLPAVAREEICPA